MKTYIHLFIILSIILPLNLYSIEKTIQIIDKKDDGEEYISDKALKLNSSDLELGEDNGEQIVGMIFRNLDIPKNSVITSSYLEFVARYDNDIETNLQIRFENSITPNKLDDNNKLYSRTYLPPIPWVNVEKWNNKKSYKSVDISSSIRTLINNENWNSKSDILISVIGTGRRNAYAFDKDYRFAPKLIINYIPNNFISLKSPKNNVLTENSVNLIWESDYKNFEIYLGDSESNFNIIDGQSINDTEYIVDNLKGGKKYFWKIIAKSDQNEDIESSIESFVVSLASDEIIINEFMASNLKSVPELYDFEDFPDWIEIHNPTDNYIDISNYKLSDNSNVLDKWSFPSNIYLPPNGFIVLWADDLNINKNLDTLRSWYPYDLPYKTIFYHLNFKLSKSGESIYLSNNSNNLIDSINYKNQITDVSYGRNINDKNQWEYYVFPTPGSENSTQSSIKNSRVEPPYFSISPGYYQNPINVEILNDDEFDEIRYTLDGSFPNENSKLYTQAISIDKNTVIHAISLKSGMIGSNIVSAGYLFEKADSIITTVHLYTEKKYLFDEGYGIYTNTLKEREIPVNIDIIEKNKTYNMYAGIRIGGENIFRFAQKPLNVYSDKDYGTESFDYQIFDDKPRDKFDRLYLRNAGDDWANSFILDAFQRELVRNDIKNPTQAYKPATVYINGSFFGIHNIREKITEDYFIQNYEARKDEIDHLEYNSKIILGSNIDFNKVKNFAKQKDLQNEEYYKFIKDNINIESYIDFYITQIYIINTSMGHNREYWRNRAKNGKWEWILVDLDRGFNKSNLGKNFIKTIYEDNDFFFYDLCQNNEFRNKFIQRYNYYFNTSFQPDNVNSLIDKMADRIKPLMDKHINRWSQNGGIPSISKWNSNLDNMKLFGTERFPIALQNFKDLFNLNREVLLSINKIGNGDILIDDKIMKNNTLNINYSIDDNPLEISLKIIPNVGYKIKSVLGFDIDVNTFSLNSDSVITVIFEKDNYELIPELISTSHLLEKNKTYYAPADIIIEENAELIIEQGVTIKFSDNISIIDHGSLIINGTTLNPVSFELNTDPNARIPINKDEYRRNKWGAVIIDNATDTAFIDYLIIRGASSGKNSNLYKGALSVNNSNIIAKGLDIDSDYPVLTWYGSVEIYDSKFYSNVTCDYINYKYSDYAVIDNCDFVGSFAFDTDAIDFDNINNGIVSNNRIYNFQGFNSDAIDIGEGSEKVIISNNFIYNCIDKGVSVGQASTAIIKNNVIMGCTQGVGVKDKDSKAYLTNNTFYKNNISVASFEKNPRAGGGQVFVNNNISYMATIMDYFYDQYSSIDIKYSLSDMLEYEGIGNIRGNPNLVDPNTFNFQLQDNSICIDSGDPSLQDDDGTRSDIGAFNFNQDINLDIIEEYRLFINEVSANNPKDSLTDDWLELYNAGNLPINIGNMYLSDDINDLLKFKVNPEQETILIQPKSFYTFVADNNIEKGLDHTNFKLSTNGETLYLTSKDGTNTIDQFTYFEHDYNRTFGRYPDGSDNIILLFPTKNDNNSKIPNSVSNNTLEYFTAFPNPVKDNLFIKLSGKYFKSFELEIYDLNSRQLLSETIIKDKLINMSYLSSGTYILLTKINGQQYFKKIVKK